VDQAAVVIREATDEYLLGEEAYRAGDLEAARAHFDAALLAFMTSGLPVQDNQRLKRAYDRIVQDIQSLESEAVAGMEEIREEPGGTPLEDLKDITKFLSPEELALEMEKIRPPSEGDDFSIPVVLNTQVLTFIEAFQRHFREAFAGGYQRMGRYEGMIRQTLREEGLPEDLIYLAFTESTFKPHAYSRARAKGIWQFMASTGSRYGLVRNAYVDERSDPEKATRAAARYLKDLYAMFGDWYLVMAAYNAGEGLVIRAIDRTGRRDFWDLAKTRSLRSETKNFVPSILALSIMSRDPDRYGHPGLRKDPPLEFDRATLDGPTDLALLARLAGSTVDEIKLFNPQLTRTVTPPGYRAYEVRIPRGAGEAFRTAYAALPASEKIASVRASYRVRKGDTLAGMARRFGTSASVLAEANGISVNAHLATGMTLVVPGGVETASSRGRARSRPSAVRPGAAEVRSDGRYIVRPGDTLSDIARRHGMTVARLTAMNGISDAQILRPGQSLNVRPTGEDASPAAPRAAAAPSDGKTAVASGAARKVTYRVRRGDNLYRIAQRHGITLDSLLSWNNLSDASRIYPGDILTIYAR